MPESNLTALPPMVFHSPVEFRPLGNRVVLVVETDKDQKTASGLHLPAKDRERPLIGKVVAVGEGPATADGKHLLPIPLKEGDRVVFERYAGTEIRATDKPAILVLEYTDIMGVVS